ncbi:MAG: hypothetical protein E6Z25_01985 [Negativicoccus succinicivorans]|uniref:hypothetical protein n=1 Tax=Negativicoccus succinicivorans TaxID=620903 RepID=UPI00290DB9CB|nr:hypothetical protein [Negativicoccus succinicivorans]MDU5914823.1 hypothetical protein [Negativicoccus succinicivorans]
MAKHLTYLAAAFFAALTVTTNASYAAAPVAASPQPTALATATENATAQRETFWQNADVFQAAFVDGSVADVLMMRMTTAEFQRALGKRSAQALRDGLGPAPSASVKQALATLAPSRADAQKQLDRTVERLNERLTEDIFAATLMQVRAEGKILQMRADFAPIADAKITAYTPLTRRLAKGQPYWEQSARYRERVITKPGEPPMEAVVTCIVQLFPREDGWDIAYTIIDGENQEKIKANK